MAALRVLKD